MKSLSERLWSRVNRDGDCWEWTGYRRESGHGQLSGPDGKRLTSPHRVAYELECGPIPEGMVVMHKCDNPPCCNPDHLELGTQADNLRDMFAKGRHRTGRLTGERHGKSKLTDAQRVEIRERYDPEFCEYVSGKGTTRVRSNVKELAQEFGVSRACIRYCIEQLDTK